MGWKTRLLTIRFRIIFLTSGMPIPLLKGQQQRICLRSHHVNRSLMCAPWPCSLDKPMPKPLRRARSFSLIPVGLIVFIHHIFAGTEGFGQSWGYGDGYLSILYTSTPCNAAGKFVTWRVAINFKENLQATLQWKGQIFSKTYMQTILWDQCHIISKLP